MVTNIASSGNLSIFESLFRKSVVSFMYDFKSFFCTRLLGAPGGPLVAIGSSPKGREVPVRFVGPAGEAPWPARPSTLVSDHSPL